VYASADTSLEGLEIWCSGVVARLADVYGDGTVAPCDAAGKADSGVML
jgi:hypothetical protein